MAISPAQAITLGADAAYLSRRDPPTAPDGQYDWQVEDDGDTKKGHSIITNLVEEDATLKRKGIFVPNAKAVVGCISSSALTTMIEQPLT